MNLELSADLTVNQMVETVRAMAVEEWAADLHMFCSELHVVQDEPRRDGGSETVESAGGVSEVRFLAVGLSVLMRAYATQLGNLTSH